MDNKIMNKTINQRINILINQEFYGAYMYHAMSLYLNRVFMNGLADFVKHHAIKKINSAQKIQDYLILYNEKLMFLKIDKPDTDWKNITELFINAKDYEEYLLRQKNEIYSLLKKENDNQMLDFFREMKNKQKVLVNNFKRLLFMMTNSNNIPFEIINSDKNVSKI